MITTAPLGNGIAMHSPGWAPEAFAQNPWLTEILRGLYAKAEAIQGAAAFESTRSSAAFHEAGHCVIGAVDGNQPRRVRIKRIGGAKGWTGVTDYHNDGAWAVDEHSPVEGDLRRVRDALAGWGAELLFEPLRMGQSLDELVLAGAMCKTAAGKLGRDPEDVLDEQIRRVLGGLKAHERSVRAIAAALQHHIILRGKQLARLLPAQGRGP
jgi:hypothetical protein